ncbi:MAG TPA: hypothetical protein VGE93_15305 [Bryobacteraceae bacterium]
MKLKPIPTAAITTGSGITSFSAIRVDPAVIASRTSIIERISAMNAMKQV